MKTPAPVLPKECGRREFLGTTLTVTMALAALGHSTAQAQNPSSRAPVSAGQPRPLPFNPRTAAAMPMRNLGRTGFRVGIFSLGCQAAIEIKGNEKLSVSTNIVGVDNIPQLEDNLKCAASFVPLSAAQMRALEECTLPIVRQALYFRRWELGA